MKNAIKEALSLLQKGTALDVVAAIQVLQKALIEPKPCLKCDTPKECELNDKCIRSSK